MTALLLGFVVSAALTFLIIRFERAHARFSSDRDMSGPQKVHARPVPRVGGIGIALGLGAALAAVEWLHPGEGGLGLMLMACAAPAFLAGLAEDLTKTQSPRRR